MSLERRTSPWLLAYLLAASVACQDESGSGGGRDEDASAESDVDGQALDARDGTSVADFDGSGALGPFARMEFERHAFFDAPFPSDDLLLPGGRVDLSGFPNPDGTPYVETLRDIASERPGFATTAPIYFTFDAPIAADELPDAFGSVLEDASVFLVPVVGDEHLERVPVEVRFADDGGPHGAANLLSVLPYQGFPLRTETTYAAVITTSVRGAGGAPVRQSPAIRALASGGPVPGLSTDVRARYKRALERLAADGVATERVAGLAVFTTQDPTAALQRAFTGARADAALVLRDEPELVETYEGYCVFRAAVDVPAFQEGEPPFDHAGGAWVFAGDGTLSRQGTETANLWLTIPRRAAPPPGFPTVTFVRTGGGGDRPLIDRGVRGEPGGPTTPGSGPAVGLATVGIAGVSLDGPHGGLRNVTGRDEQLLIFNFGNLEAMRDNIRQSALELGLIPAFLDTLQVPVSECPGAAAAEDGSVFDGGRLALMGHSMGATIAPLTAAIQPRYSAVVLSGAGGSWIENIIHKRSPLPVRPIAELLLRYEPGTLHAHDPALALLQWAGESADPPVYASLLVTSPPEGSDPRDVLVFQGITDTYILPPIANALSLAAGVDLGGPGREAEDPESAAYQALEPLLALNGRGRVSLPARANVEVGGRRATAVVVQHLEDGIEDGHEVMFQLAAPKRQYAGFLESWASGEAWVPQ